jgi:hypothetical protein
VKHRVTPDDRYFIVRGRLWRKANPGLDQAERADLVRRLMTARRAVCDAKQAGNRKELGVPIPMISSGRD